MEPFCQILQGIKSDYRALISSRLSPAYALGFSFPIWLSFLSSILEPIILLDMKNKDWKVCRRTRLNERISFINSQNWNRMRKWLSWWEREYTNKWLTFLKTKQFQFQRSCNCLAFSSNSLKLVRWIEAISPDLQMRGKSDI